MVISSKDNPTFKRARRLLADAGTRRREGRFVAEGARLCADAALSGTAIETVLMTPAAERTYPRQIEILKRAGADMLLMEEAMAGRLGDTAHPQGVFAVCRMPPLDNEAGLGKIETMAACRAVALESIQDPANMGAIIRTAEALGMDAVLVSDGCTDVYSPKVLRASMGGVFRLPVLPAGEMAAAVTRLRAAGLSCYACVADAAATPLTEAAFAQRSVCLIGNEGAGLLPETAAACDCRITIPMKGRAESLNAAMAAGIVMWWLSGLE